MKTRKINDGHYEIVTESSRFEAMNLSDHFWLVEDQDTRRACEFRTLRECKGWAQEQSDQKETS